MRIPLISLLAAGALALGGCAYGDFGYGGGLGYGGYYGGYGGYYGGYGYGAPYYGYGYGYDPFGWYGDYYYPGAGIYVYDSHRNRHVWSDSQRSYWTNRETQYHSHTGHNWSGENWSGYRHRSGHHNH